MNNKRKLLCKIAIGFFIILGICTFLSKTVKNMMLPEVEVIESRSGFLEYSINSLGTIGYGKNVNVDAKGEWTIKEICVKPGQAIEANTVLAKVDLENIKELQQKKELEILSLEAEIKEMKSGGTNADLLNIKVKELGLLKEEYNKISKGINENGEIITPLDGKVNTIYCSEGELYSFGTKLFEISNNSESYNVTWNSTVEEAKNLHVDNEIEVLFEGVSSISTVKGTICSKEYIEEEKSFVYEGIIDVADLKNDILKLDQSVSVNSTFNLGKESRCIIPKEAITTDKSGNSIVYVVKNRSGIFGKENYVEEVKVKILSSNNIECSIEDIGDDANHIVLNTSDSINSGDIVKIR